MTHKFEILKEAIIGLSVASEWEAARREWDLRDIYITQDWGHCLCTTSIKEHCVLANRMNGEETHVGNICVHNFMGLKTKTLFDGVNRIRADGSKAANNDLVLLAYERRWINAWERDFCWSTMNKRSLSVRQAAKRADINRKILAMISMKREGY